MLTDNGVSTTRPGQFRMEVYWSNLLQRKLVQWDYRAADGKLHSGVARSEEDARNEAKSHGYSGCDLFAAQDDVVFDEQCHDLDSPTNCSADVPDEIGPLA